MASYRSVNAVMVALEDFLKRRLPDELTTGGTNARVQLLGSADVAKPLTGNLLGLYMHRIMVDPHGRNRYFPATGTDPGPPRPELAVNLHFLMLATGNSASIEADLIAWGMSELAQEVQLTASHVGDGDPEWGAKESVQVAADEMSTEDLMRIWDVFEAKYTVTVPYVVKSVRIALEARGEDSGPVITRVLPAGTYA